MEEQVKRGGKWKEKRKRRKGNPPIISYTPQFRFTRNVPGNDFDEQSLSVESR